MSQLIVGTYCYLKNLNRVYFACWRLLYGIKDKTLFTNNEPSKALWNSKCSNFFIESFKGHKLSKNKAHWLDLTSRLWPSLVGLSLEWRQLVSIMKSFVKYSKHCLTSFSLNYSSSIQYMKNDNGENGNIQHPLNMNSSYTWDKLI